MAKIALALDLSVCLELKVSLFSWLLGAGRWALWFMILPSSLLSLILARYSITYSSGVLT